MTAAGIAAWTNCVDRLEVEQRTTADDGRFGSRHTELVGLGRSMKMVDYEVWVRHCTSR